jgi:integrase
MQGKAEDNLGRRLAPWIEKFIAGIPHVQGSTRRTYRYHVKRFVRYLEASSVRGKRLPIALKRETMVAWLRDRSARLSLRTIDSRIVPVCGFLSFLEGEGVLRRNPLKRLQERYPRKGLRGIVRALTGESPRKSLQALKARPRFTSPLGPSLQGFIALERSHGKLYEGEEGALRRFDRFLRSYPNPPRRLSDSILRRWLRLFSGLHPSHRYKNSVLIRKFCIYLRRFDPEAYVPDSPTVPCPTRFLPHIYSRSQIASLLEAAGHLTPSAYSPLRPQMLRLLVSLLYTTGMRIGEALKLRLCDIDWKEETLHVREAKFFKSRLVPLSRSMAREMKRYVRLYRRSSVPINHDSPLFQNPRTQRPYSKSCVRGAFHLLCDSLGIRTPAGARPRFHDLRHTFAVHRLEDWYRKGEDVQSKLGLLSTYMGHGSISGTQRYLTMTTELLQHASGLFDQYFSSAK